MAVDSQRVPTAPKGRRVGTMGAEGQRAQAPHRSRLARELVSGDGVACECFGHAGGVSGVGVGVGAVFVGAEGDGGACL